MHQYILRRLLLMLPTLLGVAVIVFLLMRVIPGDIVEMRFAEGRFVDQALLEKERARLGLDRPVWAQFVGWLWGIVRLDFGLSMWSGGPISREIAIRLQLSLQLAIMATTVAVLLAIPLGTLAALRQDTWIDYAIRVFSIAGLATPSFWLGILMFLGFLMVFQWIPQMVFTPICQDTWQNLIVKRHALKNAMLPVLTVIGLEFAVLIGGLVVTEQVFNLNGLGLLFVQSVARRDYTLVQALVLLVAFVYIMVNLGVDLLYAWLDPRIRYQ